MTLIPLELLPLLAGAGFVIGLLVGLTGVGAGSLTTPMLISGFGVPPVVAVGTDLLFAALTKASAAWRHHRQGNVDWRIFLAMASGSVPGALAVLAWIYWVAPGVSSLSHAIRGGLAVALVFSALSICLYPRVRRRPAPAGAAAASAAPIRSRLGCMALVGALIGSLVALTSIGAGALGIVALALLFPALAARKLVGTDIVHAVPLTLVCGAGHLGMGSVDPGILLALLAGSLPGIALGARATGRIPEPLLRVLLAIILVLAAAVVLLK
jgi:hypothetical protein